MKSSNSLLGIAGAILMSMTYTSCTTDTNEPNQFAITETTLNQFKDLGFDVSDIQVDQSVNPLTGIKEKMYVLEGDIAITEENLLQMVRSEIAHEGACGEQYRTTNLVGGLPRTIRVMGYTGGSQALDSKMRTALQWAVDNYNALNTGLNFTLTFGTNYSSYDMVVYKVSGAGGGSAGFPSGGNPYKFIQIQAGTSNYDTNVVEHVITHEMGHCLGLRHTDYFNRSLSCGSGGNEGSSGVGAIHIPGTPTGFDANSIMLACFSSSEDGEFGSFDRTALEYLY
ncbi:M57 family metalloprotease [Cytophagales bacterium LB-30]|uniref:M57 family metalloprotease n=1 Tax=Shiella aurantiaca TaxID=3058365 RepID=A0ABT8F0P9_9BACT|nr:M57 family metalloprotease [Shiella aurantiaca]MDN4163997.1 M57 family metalloprotease [Shiella aurantiaca]